MSEKPIEQINVGSGIKAEAWANQSDDGKEYFTVKMSRAYRDNEGEWHETNTYSRDHLPKLAVASNMMFQRLLERQYTQEQSQSADEGFAGKETARRAKKRAPRATQTERE